MVSFITNRFGGIREKSAYFSPKIITAKNIVNVELFKTGDNNGIGIRTSKGHTSIVALPDGERVVSIFYSVQNTNKHTIIHTVSAEQGKLYEFSSNTLTLITDGLSVTRTSAGRDFMQGYTDCFIFTNGTDKMQMITFGAQTTVTEIDAVDDENRNIRPKGLAVMGGRLFAFQDNRLHWCKQQDVTVWNGGDYEVLTSAGYIETTKNITAIIEYLSSIAVFSKDSSWLFSGEYPDFKLTDESPGGCAGLKSLVFHGTDLYFYDNTKKSIFSFQQVVLGQKTLNNKICSEIQSIINSIGNSNLDEIVAKSVIINDRNELWFLLQNTELTTAIHNGEEVTIETSTILIYDTNTDEWVKRVCPKIYDFINLENALISGNKKLYYEYNGEDFDGYYIPASYICSDFTNGSVSAVKICSLLPVVTLQNDRENEFWVRYIKDYGNKEINKKVQATIGNVGIFDDENSLFDEALFAGDDMYVNARLPKISPFKCLSVEFFTKTVTEEFSISRFEQNMLDTILV